MDDLLVNQFLLLGAILFCIGVYGVIARKNTVLVLMSIELILNAVNINLLTFGALQGEHHRLGVRAVHHRRGRGRGRGGPGDGADHLPQPVERRPRRHRRDEGLTGTVLENAWIIPLIPAASFFLILFFGKRLPKKGSEIGIAAVGIAFVLAIATNVQWFDHVNNPPDHGTDTHSEEEAPAEGGEEEHGLGAVTVEGESAAPTPVPAEEAQEGESVAEEEHTVEPIEKGWTWFENGGVDIEVGMLLDGPAVMMLFVVTLVSLLVHVYSTDYVAGDRRYTHFFAFLSLFTASMLGLIMAKTTLQLHRRAGSWWASVPSCSSGTGGRRRPTATPPSRPSSPTAWATWACSSA